MIGVLGISHKDLIQARMWLAWASRLKSTGRLLVFYSARASNAIRSFNQRPSGLDATFLSLDHFPEHGYPGAASHLFVNAMTEAGNLYPNEPLLWLESDAIPTKPGWFESIAAEYATSTKPFMGHLESEHAIPHLAGVAVYPPNWKELSPMLATSHEAPDIPYWGRGKGQAFDAYAAPEVFPQAQQSRTIQQVFGKRTWVPESLKLIRPEAVLVHQSKDGSLIRLLERQYR